MAISQPSFEPLLEQIRILHRKHDLAKDRSDHWFKPGIQEYLEQYDGYMDPAAPHRATLRFDVRGTRYEGRIHIIEQLSPGNPITIRRDPGNAYNPNNFELLTSRGYSVGNIPAELCSALASLYDARQIEVVQAFVSYVEPLSTRCRYAKQPILFIELQLKATHNL